MIVLDTGVLFGLEIASDERHDDATRVVEEAVKGRYGTVVITDYIFDETVTLTLARTKNLAKAIAVGEKLNSIEILKVDQPAFENAWKIFKAQKSGKKLSFTDCTTISIMEFNGIDKIASFDSGFSGKGIDVIR